MLLKVVRWSWRTGVLGILVVRYMTEVDVGFSTS